MNYWEVNEVSRSEVGRIRRQVSNMGEKNVERKECSNGTVERKECKLTR